MLDEDVFYTHDVKRLLHGMKAELPADFELLTRIEDMDGFYHIVIEVSMYDFAKRTVEDRLAIAVKLERLRQLIEETGIRCAIEKDWYS